MNIANKTLLITGANRGIGRALVDEALRREVKRVYAGTRGAPLTAGAWGFYINESLRRLITTGKGEPNEKE